MGNLGRFNIVTKVPVRMGRRYTARELQEDHGSTRALKGTLTLEERAKGQEAQWP